ncbi:putative effector protein [Erysiphe necator]|uniref:Putative effector protein n=1 Tax=Uncinula necator TaxID=52586 RepID=A0A0B1P476_UNCNE|nr:putative effector protein [Erysiphe necator]
MKMTISLSIRSPDIVNKLQSTEENEYDFDEEFPPLTETANSTYNIVDQNNSSPQKTSAAPLMAAIKGLLDLTNDYLQNLDKEHPGVGADFLALLADGASRAMRGERVYASLQNTSKVNTYPPKATWAQKVASDVHDLKQSKEDRRVIIRLSPNHEARKTGSFELRQKVQSVLSDKSLVSDAWFVPSGVAILAPSPTKAATLMQFKDTIEKMFGEATVERQETWKTFVIGPIPKTIRGLDGVHNTMEGPLQEELAFVRDIVPIRYMGWTRRSQNEEPYGYIRICVPESRADKFPSRLRIFGEAVSIQRIRPRSQITVCEKCFGFHATRLCARSKKCWTCGADAHNGTCQSGPRCLNCRGPHSSNDVSCPARPRRSHGILKRPTGAQLHHIRTLGGREYVKVNSQKVINLTTNKTSTTETEIVHSSQ